MIYHVRVIREARQFVLAQAALNDEGQVLSLTEGRVCKQLGPAEDAKQELGPTFVQVWRCADLEQVLIFQALQIQAIAVAHYFLLACCSLSLVAFD